jgi:hypothetical protein
VAVVDLLLGRVIATLEFQTAVEEVFDVQLLVGSRFPELMGFQKDTVRHTFALPAIEQLPWTVRGASRNVGVDGAVL